MVGRGFRIAPEKRDCLVLDFGGNVRTHGPVDQIQVQAGRKGPKKPAKPLVKTCPECDEFAPLGTRTCAACGYEWPESQRAHETRADDVQILGGEKASEWLDVDLVKVAAHTSRSSGMTTLRVDYVCGLRSYSEYVCLEHVGFARRKAEQWWRQIVGPGAVPRSIEGAVDFLREGLPKVAMIEVQPEGRYERVVGHVKADDWAPREYVERPADGYEGWDSLDEIPF
jgi:DNA repair protein RadD